MVGEAKIVGMMGSIALTNKATAQRSNRTLEPLALSVANAVLRTT